MKLGGVEMLSYVGGDRIGGGEDVERIEYGAFIKYPRHT